MRFAIFCCEDAEKWKDWTERLWSETLRTPGDTFITFRCHQGEFPEPATCRERFDAIVIGGSHYSAYDDLPWIQQLERLLPEYIDAGIRVVGCCFGHQLLAKALGGAVGKNPSGRFVLGVEDVSVDDAAARECGLVLPSPPPPHSGQQPQQPQQAQSVAGRPDIATESSMAGAASSAAEVATSTGGGHPAGSVAGPDGSLQQQRRRQLRMLQSHGDQVLVLPPGASLLAMSGTAANEMWALGNRCLAFQFHPELTPELVYDKIWAALSASGRINAEESAAAEAQLKAGPGSIDSDLFLRALSAYLRAPLPEPRIGSSAASSGAPSVPRREAATAAQTAAASAEAAASGGVQVAKELRQALERKAGGAAEAVLGHVRQAAAAGLASGTANAELLTALNQGAAAAYSRAATTAERAAAHLTDGVAAHQVPLKAALASLGALEAQLDRLAEVVGSLEVESAVLEEQAEAQAREARAQQQQDRVQAQQ